MNKTINLTVQITLLMMRIMRVLVGLLFIHIAVLFVWKNVELGGLQREGVSGVEE